MNIHKTSWRQILVTASVFLIVLACGTSPDVIENNRITEVVPTDTEDPNLHTFKTAISLIESELAFNSTGIDLDPDGFLYKMNPVGEGMIIYEPETRFNGVERNFIWIFFDGMLFVPNGATKGVTPNVQWPRDIEMEKWSRTRLDPGVAIDLIAYLYEGKELFPYETPIPLQTENLETRFGYSIDERKEIYKDIIRAEDKAIGENLAYDTYYSEVLEKYGLSLEELEEIAKEGTQSRWPMPPPP